MGKLSAKICMPFGAETMENDPCTFVYRVRLLIRRFEFPLCSHATCKELHLAQGMFRRLLWYRSVQQYLESFLSVCLVAF